MKTAAVADLDFFMLGIPETSTNALVVRLVDEHGREGWGESACVWRPTEVAPRRDALLAAVAGRNVFDIEELLELDLFTDPRIRCAMEMASWDLVGRILDQPIHHLIGGAYRRRIPIAVRLEAGSEDETVRLARQMADQGFHSLVVLTTGNAGGDVDLARRLCEGAGARIELRLDAGQQYDMESAAELCALLEAGCVESVAGCVGFLIDPVPTTDPAELQMLQRRTTISLAARRPIGGPADVLRAVGKETVGLVVVDLQTVGGILPARKCAAVAEAASAAACLAQGPSVGISTAAMLQVAACTPAFTFHNELACESLEYSVLAESFDLADAMLTVPQGPGLGIRVDRDRVDALQVG